jgi:hypothetical protein
MTSLLNCVLTVSKNTENPSYCGQLQIAAASYLAALAVKKQFPS